MRTHLNCEAADSASLDPQLLERLRTLPEQAPPPYEFAEFSRRYARRRQRATQRPLRLLAAAAAVVVAGWVVRHGLAPLLGEVGAMAGAPLAEAAPGGVEPDGSSMGSHRPVLLPTVNAESWLSAHPRQALVRVPAQMAVTELEDQIATMDDQLTAASLSKQQLQQLALLQRDRAQLVESLAQVRYAQNLLAGLQ